MKKKKLGEQIATRMIIEVLKARKDLRVWRRDNLEPWQLICIDNETKNVELLSRDNAIEKIVLCGHSLYESIKNSPQNEFDYPFTNVDFMFLTHASAKSILNTILKVDSLKFEHNIKDFAFPGDESYTFYRIPFSYNPTASFPECFKSLLSGFTNSEAICLWIGSIFDLESNRTQYLWMYGPGGNGKSTLAKIIASVLGEFVKFEVVPARDDKYWTNGLIGKRLIVLDDCNNYGFVRSGLFKSLTGACKVRVEKKFEDSFDIDINCKFLFTSNERPTISNDASDMRRIIYSSSLSTAVYRYDPNFDSNLKKHLPEFISYCISEYKNKVIKGDYIPCEDIEAVELAESSMESVTSWIANNFDLDPEHLLHVKDFRKALDKTNLNDRQVYKFLEKIGIYRKPHKVDGEVVKCLKGLKPKEYSDFF